MSTDGPSSPSRQGPLRGPLPWVVVLRSARERLLTTTRTLFLTEGIRADEEALVLAVREARLGARRDAVEPAAAGARRP